jgi:hypothetical protein
MVLENLFDVIGERTFDVRYSLYNRMTLSLWKRRTNDICNRYKIDPIFRKMYLDVQKKFLERMSKKNVEKNIAPSEQFKEHIYADAVWGRVNELMEEFLQVEDEELFHSSNAIVRYMVDMYIRMLYCRHDPSYKKVIVGDAHKRFPPKGDMIRRLKSSNITIPYIRTLNKNEFLDTVSREFNLFSEMFHPSQESFAGSIWAAEHDEGKKAKPTNLYIMDDNKTSVSGVVVLTNRTHDASEFIVLMHQFFTYCCYIVDEMDITKQNKPSWIIAWSKNKQLSTIRKVF